MKMTKMIANALLLIVAVLWGSGFVATKFALDANVPAGFINFFRGLIFAFFIFLFFYKKICKMNLKEFKAGLVVGLLNFGGYITQTIGIKYTTPSNSAFITAAYVVIVPIIAWGIYRKKIEIKSWISIAFCLLGMAILTGIISKGLTINVGDIYSLACALFCAGCIVYLSYGAKAVDVSIISFMMAMVQAIGGLIFCLVSERAQFVYIDWSAAIVPLLYMGIMCSFAAQTIQVLAQKHTSATSAALILMLEALFGSFFSIAFGFEVFTVKLILGGILVMFSLVIMEIKLQPISTKAHSNFKE